MLLPQDRDASSMRNVVLLWIILQGKVKTQSFCVISGFKKQESHGFEKQRSHGSQLTLSCSFWLSHLLRL